MSWPSQIGRYRVAGLLATGGMAEVLLASLEGPGGFRRPVVIKRILPHLGRQSQFRSMFLDEARLVASLQHPNVVQVQELGEDGEELYIVMEYLAGESLTALTSRLRKRKQRLPFSLCAHVIAEAAGGLHAAHEMTDDFGRPLKLVHRDVSPQNVFVTYEGVVKILDFGIAKAADIQERTEVGVLKGKLAYMSPEQARSERLDRRSDVFSLGTILYEISTERRLFKRRDPFDTVEAIRNFKIPPPSKLVSDYPEGLEAICRKALARPLPKRYLTAGDMGQDLALVARTLEPSSILREQLSSLMHDLFADRIEAKQEMYRRVQAGSTVPQLLSSASGDVAVDTGTGVIHSTPRSRSGITGIPTISAVLIPRRWPFVLALALGAILGGVGLAWYAGAEEDARAPKAAVFSNPRTERSENNTPKPVPEPKATPKSEKPTRSAADAAVVSGAPEAQTIAVRVATVPSGAQVSALGVPRGITPVTFQLDKSSEPVALRLTLRGHQSTDEEIVPDADKHIRLHLLPQRTRRSKRPRRTPPAPPTMSTTPPPAPERSIYRFE